MRSDLHDVGFRSEGLNVWEIPKKSRQNGEYESEERGAQVIAFYASPHTSLALSRVRTIALSHGIRFCGRCAPWIP